MCVKIFLNSSVQHTEYNLFRNLQIYYCKTYTNIKGYSRTNFSGTPWTYTWCVSAWTLCQSRDSSSWSELTRRTSRTLLLHTPGFLGAAGCTKQESVTGRKRSGAERSTAQRSRWSRWPFLSAARRFVSLQPAGDRIPFFDHAVI